MFAFVYIFFSCACAVFLANKDEYKSSVRNTVQLSRFLRGGCEAALARRVSIECYASAVSEVQPYNLDVRTAAGVVMCQH